MEYSYNRICDEMKQLVNKSALIWLIFMTCVSLIVGVSCLYGILPAAALWSLAGIVLTGLALLAAVHFFHKRVKLLAQKHQLSIMAYHAKQVINSIQQQIPDTLISDSKIKIRYLARHGIDVDAALARLGQNIEAYNERALAFLREIDRHEDTLYDLMQAGALIQYGTSAHALRVQANELGLVTLTDTAFFHEIEAYAGSLDIVRANWKKLSLELDEAYTILNAYTRSLGLREDAVDKDGNHMTFKKWNEQLQEAFHALEIYDTSKAKQILNELVKFQIDSDITKSLKAIITNIDDMMAN
ncbi:MAG: hypothetical protein K2N73_06685 [Lachnospiraceae bacterium]|nr:hypothetical protein [Lachnospiraceae bacterium]